MADQSLEGLACRLADQKSLRDLFAVLNYDFADEPVNKERWNEDERSTITEARVVARKDDYRVYYLQTDTCSTWRWRGISARIIRESHGLCLVCTHNPTGIKWVFSGMPGELSRHPKKAVHIPVHVRQGPKPCPMGTKGFFGFLKKITVSEGDTATSVRARMSAAFDSLAAGMPAEQVLDFDTFTDREFQSIFLDILLDGAKATSYKHAFCMFLLDYSRHSTETHVEYSEIARYFLKYYWLHAFDGTVRHIPNPNKNVRVIGIISRQFDKSYGHMRYEDARESDPERVRRCTEAIARECFHDVTSRFQRLKRPRSAEVRAFFDYVADDPRLERDAHAVDLESGVDLNPAAMRFLRNNYESLRPMVVREWVRFLAETCKNDVGDYGPFTDALSYTRPI